jgi:MYXO-CTERM domain-containing protein
VSAGETVWASIGLTPVVDPEPEQSADADSAREAEAESEGSDADADADTDADADSDADTDADSDSDSDSDSDTDTDTDALTCAERGGYCADWASQGCRDGYDPTDPVECLTDVCCAPAGDAAPGDGCGCRAGNRPALAWALLLLGGLVAARGRARQ